MTALTIEIADLRGVLKGWIGDHLRDAFPSIGGIYYENQEFSPPVKVFGSDEASSWFFIEVVTVSGTQADFGTNNPLFESVGNVYVHCRTPLDIGDGQAYVMAGIAENIMRRSEGDIGVSGLTLRAPWSRAVRMDGWFEVMVTCPYRARATQY